MPQISVRNVSISYERKPIISEVSFDVEKGDYLCIVGENGSGKTTLMKGLLGLIPINSGRISFGEGVKANHIGYLPQQNPAQKDFPASVFEVVISGCLNQIGLRPFYSHREKRKAVENLIQLGIIGLKNKPFKSLSAGQQQRVLLARALCAAEKVLILDEPVSGLDPIITVELYEIIRKLNQEGTTVMMISHDVNAAVENANKILHLSRNSLFFGMTGDYLNSEMGRLFFLGGGKND
ncbi:MAG: metal ABC transporter ATP-binding protein [Eubacteriales bacterium]|nr:metal ABC transporter ATP-binding protein [Eubacteriales bacterium]MDD3199089.1 metal ABC transporter ATP-binding protein [Eubacteriales bacterium]MDD4629668.1 metal ABC transporter ATP-binding protein [Eubacteriales bacterium]